MELLVAGTPGSWFPKAMETYHGLGFLLPSQGKNEIQTSLR